MGVVVKQSFWGTFITYLGVIIGYVNALYLRPEFFSLNEIGLFTLVTANAMILSPLTTLGMNGTFLKYYPSLKDSQQLVNQFFTFQFLFVILGNIFILSIGFFAEDWIVDQFSKGSSEYAKYLTVTAIIVIVNSLFDHLYSYAASVLKVIYPSFLREVFLRFGAVALVLGYAFGYFEFDWAVKGLAINYIIAFFLLFLQLMISNGLRLDFSFKMIDKEWRKKILNFGIYSMSIAVSFAILNNASYTQVSSMMGDAANGVFVTCFFIGVIVEMPRRNMARILAPLISDAMNDKDIPRVEQMYKKGSITMAVIGFLLFIGIVTNINDLLSFIPQGDDFSKGLGVVWAVSGAKLILMVSSFSGEIINYSKDYWYNLLFQALAALSIVILNYIFIPFYGLNGVAISYTITIILHVLAKYLLIRKTLGITPFLNKHFSLLIISVLVLIGAYYFQLDLPPVVNIAIRSILTTLVFVFLVYKLKISDDINRLIDMVFSRIGAINQNNK